MFKFNWETLAFLTDNDNDDFGDGSLNADMDEASLFNRNIPLMGSMYHMTFAIIVENYSMHSLQF